MSNFIIHENKIRSLILIIIYVGTNRRKSTTILNFKIIFVLNFLKWILGFIITLICFRMWIKQKWNEKALSLLDNLQKLLYKCHSPM